MNDAKYIGLDVHQATISVAVLDSAGKLVMEAILETKANTILQFIHGLRGSLQVTFEEGTCAAWLHDLLKPHVTEVLVCDPRKSASMRTGNKNDRADARKLAELLYLNKLSPVYHGAAGIRALRELARSYLAITRDLTRVMSRLKAIYRSWAIPCAGQQVYAPRYRTEWLTKITEAGGAPSRRTLLSTVRRLGSSAPASATGAVGRGRETSRGWIAPTNSLDWPDSSSPADRAHPDTAPLPYQAATVGLQRPGAGDLHQRGIPLRG